MKFGSGVFSVLYDMRMTASTRASFDAMELVAFSTTIKVGVGLPGHQGAL